MVAGTSPAITTVEDAITTAEDAINTKAVAVISESFGLTAVRRAEDCDAINVVAAAAVER